jgi:selenocysteine lyase/cysteine desulfurase
MPEIWEQYAAEFPVRRNVVYLNHAGVSPLCKPAADAIERLAVESRDFGSLYYERWLATYQGLRTAAAELVGASPREIGLVKNTSEGISIVANGIDWRRGDRVVAFHEEFPSNWFPWKRLEEHGVTVTWLHYDASLDQIDEAARGARLLAISYVQYLSGYRADLESIGRICADHGVFFLVDAIQGLGAFPLDVERAHVHALAADGHKWMMGPEGCGILYVRQEVQDRVRPLEWGWMNVANSNDFLARDMTLRADAGRYECGSLNTIGCYGLRAALEFIHTVGVGRIGDAVQALGDRLYAALEARGFEILGKRTAQTGAGIVSFRKPGEEPRYTVRKLKHAEFLAAPRQEWVRVSPHFYIPPEDLDRMVEEVAR